MKRPKISRRAETRPYGRVSAPTGNCRKFLTQLQFHIRGIDVQHQSLRHLAPLATHQVQLHEQLVERIEIHGDLARFRRVPPVRRQLHPVQRAYCRPAARSPNAHTPHAPWPWTGPGPAAARRDRSHLRSPARDPKSAAPATPLADAPPWTGPGDP